MKDITSVNDYLTKDSDSDKLEFAKLLEEYKKTLNPFDYFKICIKGDTKLAEYLAIASKLKGESKKMFGMGFFLVEEEYEDYPNVINYLSRCMLEEIYLKIDLEHYIHTKYNSKEDVVFEDVKNYVFDKINEYDENLYEHVVFTTNIYNTVINEIKTVINNWHIYEEDNIIDAYKILDFINEYIDSNESSSFDEQDYVLYLLNKFNIDIYNMYNEYDGEMTIQDVYDMNFSFLSIQEEKELLKFKKAFLEFTKDKKIDSELYVENNNKKTR